MTKIKRILLECTCTYLTGLRTGVQRVVRNVVRYSPEAGRQSGIGCRPVILSYGRFRTVEDLPEQPPSPREAYNSHRLVVPGAGDLILLLDSPFYLPVWDEARRARSRGAVVGTAIYDLIPITHPRYVPPTLNRTVRDWLEEVIANSDFVLTISRRVAEEFKEFIRRSSPPERKIPPIDSFILGSDLDDIKPGGEIRQELKELFSDPGEGNTYLMVGTIAPHKNHKCLLDAFDRLRGESSPIRVCLAGKIGWLCDDLLDRIRSHPLYNRGLFLFHDLNDTELDYSYRSARALIAPSFAEGFDLPLIEGLRYGLPVLVSDIPVHHEVGGEFCAYFDPDRPDSLSRLVRVLEEEGKLPEVRSPRAGQFPDWQTSTRDLIKKAIALSDR